MQSSLQRLSSVLLLVLVLTTVCVPFVSWLFSALEFNVRSLLSDEGLRWLFKYGTESLFNYWVILFLMLLETLGAYRYTLRWHHRHTSRPALVLCALAFFLVCVCGMAVAAFWSHSPLLSVTGELFPSPLVHGLPCFLMASALLSFVLYGVLSHCISSLRDLHRFLTYGLSHYAVWLLLAMLLSFLLQCISYCFFSI